MVDVCRGPGGVWGIQSTATGMLLKEVLSVIDQSVAQAAEEFAHHLAAKSYSTTNLEADVCSHGSYIVLHILATDLSSEQGPDDISRILEQGEQGPDDVS